MISVGLWRKMEEQRKRHRFLAESTPPQPANGGQLPLVPSRHHGSDGNTTAERLELVTLARARARARAHRAVVV